LSEWNVRSIVSEVGALLRPAAVEKNLSFQFFTKTPVPKMILTDASRFRQILINILGNAIKFTEEGSVSLSMAYVPKEKDTASENTEDVALKGRLVLRIVDTGLGIASELRTRLSKPFSQLHPESAGKCGGTGLGLAYSRSLASALGGNLRLIQSELGLGSTFEISFPVASTEETFEAKSLEEFTAADVRKTAAPAIVDSKSAQPKAVFDSPLLYGVSVLVVDDAPDNQLLVSRILKLAGATVDCAENGRKGVDLALAGSYDAVLMDIQMPELDGYCATQELRSKGYTKPIIALTAHAMKDERQRCLKIGFSDHMSKPVDRAALLRKLKELVLSPPLLA
jgi:CheY-like chemotaxis protein